MELINLEVQDVILHEVFKRVDDQLIQPAYGAEVEALEQEAIDALRDRVVTAMTSATRCVKMTITKTGAESLVARASLMIDGDAELWVAGTQGLALKLAEEQKSRGIPGGVVVVFRGSAGVPARRLIGVIKAEVHNGFTRELHAGKAVLKFLRSLMLTAQTKLYKVGLFFEARPEAEGVGDARWDAYIYDETLTVKNRYGAAQYFYNGFLGLGFPESSARQTAQFHQLTKSFIQGMDVPEEEKVVLHNALVTYLKADQAPTVGIESFSSSYFADDLVKDAYEQHMLSNGFPAMPINKDLTDLASHLRTRRLEFRNKIRVTGPAEQFDQLLKVDVIEGEAAPGMASPQWTILTIKDRIESQD